MFRKSYRSVQAVLVLLVCTTLVRFMVEVILKNENNIEWNRATNDINEMHSE